MVLENRKDQSIVARLHALVSPVVAQHGLDLVELQHHRAGRYQTVRILVDKAGGVTLQECAAVSRRISADFDDAEVLEGRYTLEVSSPGIDRPLRTQADFRRKLSRRVRVELKGEDGRKQFIEGPIETVNEKTMTVGETTVVWNDVIEGKLIV